MTDFQIREEPYAGPTAQALIAEVQLEYVELYGGPDDSPIDADEFGAPDGVFLVGYLDGVAVATGALRRRSLDDTGAGSDVEIKRMYVVPEARSRGLSRVMLAALEAWAVKLGASRIVLETGLRQPAAISLYESSGYELIPGFGHYERSTLSRSFAKLLR